MPNQQGQSLLPHSPSQRGKLTMKLHTTQNKSTIKALAKSRNKEKEAGVSSSKLDGGYNDTSGFSS